MSLTIFDDQTDMPQPPQLEAASAAAQFQVKILILTSNVYPYPLIFRYFSNSSPLGGGGLTLRGPNLK